MLASAMSSSRSGALLHHSLEPVRQDQGVVTEQQAVRRELGRVEVVRDRRVDAGERVLEVGAEGPLGRVGAEQAVVDAAVLVVGVGSRVAHHMWGTSSGIV